MKVYTEVNYEFKHGVLVEQSSKSYNYTGEVSLCKGLGGSAKDITDAAGDAVTNTQENVSGVLADNPVDINVPDASLITDNITGAMQDNPLASLTADINVPQINVPDASHAMSLLTTGLEKLGENTEYVVQGIVDPIVGVGERITKAAKKAVTGESVVHEDITDILARLEKKRISKGGDPDESPLGKKTGRAMKSQQDKARKKP